MNLSALKQKTLFKKSVFGFMAFIFAFTQLVASPAVLFAESNPLASNIPSTIPSIPALNAIPPSPSKPAIKALAEDSLASLQPQVLNRIPERKNDVRKSTPPAKTVTAQYQINIGSGATVKLFNNGSYEFTHEGRTYQSSLTGVIDNRLKVNFDKDGKISSIDTLTRGEVLNTRAFTEMKDRKVLITSIEHYSFGVLFARTVISSSENSIRWTTYHLDQTIDHDSKTILGESDLSGFSIVLSTYDIYPLINSYFANIVYDPQGNLVDIYHHPSSNLNTYVILRAGELDFKEVDLLASKNRTTFGLRSLLKDDKLVLSWPSSQKLVIQDQDVTASISNGRIIFTGNNFSYASEIDNSGNIFVIVPQSDGMRRIYDIKIDDEGKVSLVLRTLEAPIAEYSVLSLNLKLYKDGSYSFIVGNSIFQSDKDGWITLRAGAGGSSDKWKLAFTDGKLIKIETLKGMIYGFETVGSRARAIKISGNSFYPELINYDQKFYKKKDNASEGYYQVYYYFPEGIDLEKYFYFLSDSFTLAFDSTSEFKPSAKLWYDDQGSPIRHEIYEEKNSYALLQAGTIDITEQRLATMKERTVKNVQALLKDDKFIKIGQSVKIEGQTFSVKSIFRGRIEFLLSYDFSDGSFKSTIDSQGNILFPIPQSNGSKNVYIVHVDAQGEITLEFQKNVALIAEYEVLSPKSRVRLYQDGSYADFYYNSFGPAGRIGHNSDSDPQGFLDGGWKMEFVDNQLKTLTIHEPFFTKSITTCEFETIGSTARITSFKYESDPHRVIYQFDYAKKIWRISGSEGLGVSYYMNGYDFASFGSIGDRIVFNDFAGFYPHVVFYWNNDAVIHARVNGGRDGQDDDYDILVKGTPDIRPDQLEMIPPDQRTLENFKKLLSDDLLVKTYQPKFFLEGKFIQVSGASSNSIFVGNIGTDTDAQGNITLTVPQADGSKHIYDVKIDDQGIVTIPLSTAKPSLQIAKVPTGVNLRLAFLDKGTYTVEYTTDFTHWTTLKEYAANSASTANLLDAFDSTAPARYYRVVKKA
ncbi:MAG: hypothetical protein EXS63_02885 [Candidatus Omnitrophica bacterium]|nr:hypothetical protein [Candidatus Omnitrophota bacterium]